MVKIEQTAQAMYCLVEELHCMCEGCVFLCDEEQRKKKNKNYLFDVFDLDIFSVPLSIL